MILKENETAGLTPSLKLIETDYVPESVIAGAIV